MRLTLTLSNEPDSAVARTVAQDLAGGEDDGRATGPLVAVCTPDRLVARGEADYILVVSTEPVPGADDFLPPPLTAPALLQRLALAERLLSAENSVRAARPLRAAVDLAAEMMFRVDFGARIRDVNTSACRLLGYRREQLLEMSIQDLSPNHDPGAWTDRWAKVRLEGTLHFQSFQRTSSGEIMPVDVSLTFLDGEGRSEDFIVSFIRDLRAQKRQEASLVLTDRLHALGLLAATTAHEINNPLSYLTSALSYLEAELSGESGAADRPCMLQAAQDGMDGARRVARIVAGLKSFARSESGESTEATKAIHLDDVLTTAERLTARHLEATTALVRQGTPGLLVRADAPSLVQVIVNLLLNAAQAMPQRPRDRNRIELRTYSTADGVAIEVADNGAGIAPAVRARIFDPFFTTKPAGLGTGLGLSVCHGIITGLGGRIEVESQHGTGATFRILLPGAPPSARATVPPHALQTLRGRVLVVDDELRQLRAFTRLLGRHALITTAQTAEEAIEQLRGGSPFDLVLCDISMGGAPGTDVRSWVARHRPELLGAFYLMTGGTFTAEARRYLELHDPPVLDKPMEGAALLALLDRHIAPDA